MKKNLLVVCCGLCFGYVGPVVGAYNCYQIAQSSEYLCDGEQTNCSNHNIEALKVKLFNSKYGINYKVRVKGNGWQDSVFNNMIAGTTGKNLPLSAVSIWLDDELKEDYILLYRVYSDNMWHKWCYDGEIAGHENDDFVINDIQIKLVRLNIS